MKARERLELSGGLGNQLFQFTAGLARSIHKGAPISFDISRIDHGVTSREEKISDSVRVASLDPVNYSFVSSKLPRIYDVITHRSTFARRVDDLFRPSYFSPAPGYDEVIFDGKKVAVLRGYFQSWKYLDYLDSQNVKIRLEVKNSQSVVEKYSEIFDFENDVAVHVRRGDYAKFKESIGLLTNNYYLNAIKEFGSSRRVIIFSDETDIEEEFPNFSNFYFTPDLVKEKSIDSLVLMHQFRNIVISNSTFSWWAAALGNSDKNVVSPSKWFKVLEDPEDLTPPSWRLMKSEWML